MNRVSQLPLPFARQPNYNPADFVPDASNAEALAWLGRTADWPERRLLFWGESGCGKTHLLHIWASQTKAASMSGPHLRGLPAPPSSGGIAIDDADQAAEETALLHLLNAARDRAVPVLLTSRVPPSRWTIQLPDLASRLRAVAAVQIRTAEPALLSALLRRLLADRQLALTDTMQDCLLEYLPRHAAAVRDAVEKLDQCVLKPGIRVTRTLLSRKFGSGAIDDNSETLLVPSSKAE